MAQPYVSGPAYLYVRFKQGGSGGIVTPWGPPYFLGTGEKGVDIIKDKKSLPVMNDIGGEVPFDMVSAGQQAFVAVQLTRWNEFVKAWVEEVSTGIKSQRGIDATGEVGSSLVYGGNTFELWVAYPYSSSAVVGGAAPKPAYVDLPPGYHFYSAYQMEQSKEEPGTRPLKSQLLFHCLRTYFPNTGHQICYDHDMSGLTGVIPN